MRVIKVAFDGELLAELDGVARELGTSRSSLIRQACREWLRLQREALLDDEYEAGYRRVPQDPAMGQALANLAAEVLPRETW